jgi:hypothetical protein
MVQALAHDTNITDNHQDGSDSGEEGLSDESDWGPDNDGSSEAVATTAGPSTSTSKTKKKHVYPSDKNPFCGVIKGVGRGNTMLSKFSSPLVTPSLTAVVQKWPGDASSKLSILRRVCCRPDGGSFAES